MMINLRSLALSSFSLFALPLVATLGCRDGGDSAESSPRDDARWTTLRARMVRDQVEARGVRDVKTLAALAAVPRHLFVPDAQRSQAYDDHPLPIGGGQTISQPFIVGYMTEALALRGGEIVLEIGTGSGYQAAILAEIASRVYSIEIVPELAASAAATLASLGYANVTVRSGDGYRGWPDAAPFDAIIVTAAPDHVPSALIDQLKPGGRLVIPVGDAAQELRVLTKRGDGSVTEARKIPVRFVPMTGEAQRQ
ncbi:MAG: protein-L-isoaspartate(D-aspartate) O-methyltransferase [bacterium]